MIRWTRLVREQSPGGSYLCSCKRETKYETENIEGKRENIGDKREREQAREREHRQERENIDKREREHRRQESTYEMRESTYEMRINNLLRKEGCFFDFTYSL